MEPTPTPTRTAPPVPTATPTPSVFRIYLPILWREEACVPESIHAEAVLVLDVSTSMQRATRGRRFKLAAAIDRLAFSVVMWTVEGALWGDAQRRLYKRSGC